MEPVWLVWARELQAIAQTGLTFATSGYDRERYTAIRSLAAQMMATQSCRTLSTPGVSDLSNGTSSVIC
jgi:Hydrolase of X-linked nucleoside diphosphate N terminal